MVGGLATNGAPHATSGAAPSLASGGDRHHDGDVELTILIAVAVPIIITVVVLIVVRNALGGSSKKREQAEQLVATGAKARATVTGIEPTGMVVNNINIQCWVSFSLEPLDRSAGFEGRKKMLINQTQMPRVGDVWPAWYDRGDRTVFAVGMPTGTTPEQLAIFREFGIPHPLDRRQSTDDNPVDDLEKLVQMKEAGALTDEEFAAAKAKLLGED